MKNSFLLAGSVALLAAVAFVPLSCGSSNSDTNPVPTDGGTDGKSDASSDTPPSDSPVDGGDVGDGGGPSVTRGEYLVRHLLICGDCHTTPDATTGQPSSDPADFLAGGRDFPIPSEAGVGHVYSRNLTPDVTTGIGLWGIPDIKNAILHGMDNEAKPLFPIMPYQMFGNMTDDDATSIAMFLKSLPPKANTVPEPTVTIPVAAPTYPEASIPHTTLASGDPNFGAAERGRYLVKLSCIECHTQDSADHTTLDFTKAFAGGKPFDLVVIKSVSANITPDPTGLAAWAVADIVATDKTDLEKGTGRHLCPPMPGGADKFGGLSDGDLNDIANFVHTLPPVANTFSCASAGCCPGGSSDAGDAGTD
jgi:mono/diheme cytochrome c family protein